MKEFIISESDLNEVFNLLDMRKVYGAKSILKGLEERKDIEKINFELIIDAWMKNKNWFEEDERKYFDCEFNDIVELKKLFKNKEKAQGLNSEVKNGFNE